MTIYTTPHFVFRGLHSVGKGLRWPWARRGVDNTWAEGGHLCLESSLSRNHGLLKKKFLRPYIYNRHVTSFLLVAFFEQFAAVIFLPYISRDSSVSVSLFSTS